MKEQRLKKTADARHVSRVFLNGDLERPLCETVKVKPGLPWRPQDVGEIKVVRTCQGELLTGSGTSPPVRSVLQFTKLEGVGELKSVLILDMEMQKLEITQLAYSLALAQYSFTILLFLLEW